MTWRCTITRVPRWVYPLFALAGLVLVTLAGQLEKSPGYMDADYYYAGGLSLAKGQGFFQPLLWNYLDDPQTIPHPSHTYWMPLASLLTAAGLLVRQNFTAARLPFWLLWGLIPPLTVYLALRVGRKPGESILAGLFALFPAFYLAYLPTPDSFSLYMLLGSGVLLALSAQGRPILRLFIAGVLAGLMHLTRADGAVWAALVVVWALIAGWKLEAPQQERPLWALALAFAALAGYFIPMTFWYGRNLAIWSSLFPPGGSRTLWLTQYEDTFLYPAALLTPQRWWTQGIGAILSIRGQALWANLQTWVAVQSSVALFPFILVGLWQVRRERLVQLGAGMWLVTFGVMSVVFPYAGINGSFFHSGAALQPMFWAAAPAGVTAVVDWLAKLRRWERGKTVRRFLQIVLVTACVLLTVGLYLNRVVGDARDNLVWNSASDRYRAIEAQLLNLGATPCLTVMVNNPPGYYAAVGRSAVVIPFGNQESLLAAARQYKVSYLLLDESNAWHLPGLYDQPRDFPGLRYLGSEGKTRIYAFTSQ